MPLKTPRRKLELALRVLDGLARDHVLSAVPARRIRTVLFAAAAATLDRAEAVELAARELGLSELAMHQGLFSDLPAERVLASLKEPLSSELLALRCNAELIASLLGRALRVRIEAHGNVRAVVRHASCSSSVPFERAQEGIQLEMSPVRSRVLAHRVYGSRSRRSLPRPFVVHTYRLRR